MDKDHQLSSIKVEGYDSLTTHYQFREGEGGWDTGTNDVVSSQKI